MEPNYWLIIIVDLILTTIFFTFIFITAFSFHLETQVLDEHPAEFKVKRELVLQWVDLNLWLQTFGHNHTILQ